MITVPVFLILNRRSWIQKLFNFVCVWNVLHLSSQWLILRSFNCDDKCKTSIKFVCVIIVLYLSSQSTLWWSFVVIVNTKRRNLSMFHLCALTTLLSCLWPEETNLKFLRSSIQQWIVRFFIVMMNLIFHLYTLITMINEAETLHLLPLIISITKELSMHTNKTLTKWIVLH